MSCMVGEQAAKRRLTAKHPAEQSSDGVLWVCLAGCLFQFCAIMEGLADILTQDPVGVGHRIK